MADPLRQNPEAKPYQESNRHDDSRIEGHDPAITAMSGIHPRRSASTRLGLLFTGLRDTGRLRGAARRLVIGTERRKARIMSCDLVAGGAGIDLRFELRYCRPG